MRLKTKFKITILGATSIIMVMANTLLFPTFPQLRSDLGIGLREVSLLVLFVSLPSALLSPPLGWLADILGRKKIIIPSLLLYGLGGLIAGFSAIILDDPYKMILLARLLQGIGSAAPMYLSVALAGDIFQSTERIKALGLMETANGIGKVLSPIVGATVGLIAWFAPFFVYPLLAVPISFAVWRLIDEPILSNKATSSLDMRWLFSSRSSLMVMAAGSFIIYSLFGTMFWLGNNLEGRLPEGTVLHGIIVSLPVIALILTALLSRKFHSLLGCRGTITFGLFVTGASLVLIPVFFPASSMWLFIVMLGVGAGLFLPAADTVATALASREHRGIITSVYGSFRSLGAAGAPYLFSVLLKYGLFATFASAAAVDVVMGLVIFLFFNERKFLPPTLQPEG